MRLIIKMLTHADYGIIKDMRSISAVGHRIGHGGEKLFKPVIIDEPVMEIIKSNIGLAPIHMPHMVRGVEVFKKLLPDIPMVAVFDTAFHQTMPKEAYIYPIPYGYYEKFGIRRYGFHGASHKYVSMKAAQVLNRPYHSLKTITCHLGSGSSIAAVKNGKSIDTSMGFTPLAGLPMGTRCGDIDPSIVGYLMENEGISQEEVNDILNKESGLLGISGMTSDCRELTEQSQMGNERAKLAIDVFCYSVRKYIGAYAAAMGGMDCLVFTGGIGENSAVVRQQCCRGLAFLGIALSLEKNKSRDNDTVISADSSGVKVLLIKTEEELMIAREAMETIQGA